WSGQGFVELLLFGPVGAGLVSLANAHEQLLVIGRHSDRGRVPAGGNESFDLAVPRLFDVYDGDTVIVGVSDGQRLALGMKTNCVGSRSFGGVGEEGREDGFLRRSSAGIDHPHRIARSTGNEQAVVLGVQG